MQRFIASQNVERYRRLLETESDPKQRARLEQLLTEAIAELKAAEQLAPGPSPSPDNLQTPTARRGSTTHTGPVHSAGSCDLAETSQAKNSGQV